MSIFFRWSRRAMLSVAVAAAVGFVLPVCAADDKPATKPRIEVVFCLDTTGSMGPLLAGAKAKIWSICNQIANGNPVPDLQVGLVAFRDRGDQYVTKVFDLTNDLDAIHGHLKTFQATGGGDTPESVNEALQVSVSKVNWSTGNQTLRIIFLVGDAPPHMDYADDVKYPVTCELACEKRIIVNTIQCGNGAKCTESWKDICVKAEGSFVQIPQDGGVVHVVSTPFDKRLSEINAEVSRTTLVYGDRDTQVRGLAKNQEAEGLAPGDASERIAFQAKNAQAAGYDLLDAVKQQRVNLDEIKKEELPKELQDKTPAERNAYLKKLEERREALRKEALELDKQRSDFITKKQAEESKTGKNSFDAEVLDVLRNQAKKHRIDY